MCLLSRFGRIWLCATPWTIAHWAPLSVGFSRQEYWSGLPCPPPGDLPDPGWNPHLLHLPALTGGLFTTSTIWEALVSKIRIGPGKMLSVMILVTILKCCHGGNQFLRKCFLFKKIYRKDFWINILVGYLMASQRLAKWQVWCGRLMAEIFTYNSTNVISHIICFLYYQVCDWAFNKNNDN